MLEVDDTYFVLDINIPKASTVIPGFVTLYMPEILTQLLGYELYELVKNYNAESSQRIKDLVEGKVYEINYNGKTVKVKWAGLITIEDTSPKISLIAYYVYYRWQQDKVSSTQVVGVVKAKQQNSVFAGVQLKISNACNRLEDLYGTIYDRKIKPTAYNFLKEFEDDYPEWIFDSVDDLNANSHDL